MGRTWAIGAVAALALAGLPCAGARAAGPPPLRALHAERDAIVDDAGRQVLLRGVNVNQLGDYFRTQPALDPVVPLTEDDLAQIAALGMDVVRLIVHWSALEPARGAFDEAYAARIRQAVGWARAHGVYVVLDMHQDAWGKFVGTGPGEACPPGLATSVGWDGAPAWATLTDGLTRCHVAQRELSPAVGQAWQSFWLDRDGIQSELVRTWARLAAAFAAEPAVAGYDLVNEPNPGFLAGANGATLMGVFYGRAIAAIRAAERATAGGFAHPVFFEPGVEWSAASVGGSPLPGFTADRDVVFSPHLYTGSLSLDRAVGLNVLSVAEGFAVADAFARAYGATVWSGEWGWFGDPATDAAQIAAYAREEDSRFWGGAWWDWKQACGDPHNFSGPGSQPGAVSPSLNRFACPAQTPLGIPASTRRILARAYPRAAPGRLTALVSDPATGVLDVGGTDASRRGSCRLDVWFPSATPPAVTGTGVSRVRVRSVPGGWRVTACARGRWSLHAAPR